MTQLQVKQINFNLAEKKLCEAYNDSLLNLIQSKNELIKNNESELKYTYRQISLHKNNSDNYKKMHENSQKVAWEYRKKNKKLKYKTIGIGIASFIIGLLI